MAIHTYNSPLEMLHAAKEAGASNCGNSGEWWNGGTDFYGPSPASLFALANKGGEETNVPNARRMLEKMEAALPETERAEWFDSVAGSYPNIPASIIGLPKQMRRKTVVRNDGAPVKIGMLVTVSAGVSDRAIQLRGTAMLAILLQLLTAGRAVELWAIAILDDNGKSDLGSVVAMRVGAGAVSLAEADMVLCNIGFCRRAPFAIQGGKDGSGGGWPRGFDYADGGKDYAAKLAAKMGFNMILPALTNHEERKLRQKPESWMLAKYHAIQAQLDGTESEAA